MNHKTHEIHEKKKKDKIKGERWFDCEKFTVNPKLIRNSSGYRADENSLCGSYEKLLDNIFELTYFNNNKPAMPLPLWHAHFGGFFHVLRNRA